MLCYCYCAYHRSFVRASILLKQISAEEMLSHTVNKYQFLSDSITKKYTIEREAIERGGCG